MLPSITLYYPLVRYINLCYHTLPSTCFYYRILPYITLCQLSLPPMTFRVRPDEIAVSMKHTRSISPPIPPSHLTIPSLPPSSVRNWSSRSHMLSPIRARALGRVLSHVAVCECCRALWIRSTVPRRASAQGAQSIDFFLFFSFSLSFSLDSILLSVSTTSCCVCL